MTAAAPPGPDFPTEDVVAAVINHLNQDHAQDLLRLCWAHGGPRDTQRATACGLDAEGLELLAYGTFGGQPVRVPFEHRIQNRPAIRQEIVRLCDEADKLLADAGPTPVEPREHPT